MAGEGGARAGEKIASEEGGQRARALARTDSFGVESTDSVGVGQSAPDRSRSTKADIIAASRPSGSRCES